MTEQSHLLNRSEFLKALGRYTVLGALAAGGALLTKRQRANPGTHACINRSVCCNCTAFKHCTLPAAQSAKQYERNSCSTKGPTTHG